VAHFVEHVTFLGSRKREKLLGTCRQSPTSPQRVT